MKAFKIGTICWAALLIVTGCQKEGSVENGNAPTNDDITVQLTADGQLLIGPDAAGVLTATKYQGYFRISTFNVIDSIYSEYAGAWFENQNNSANVGIVKAGAQTLTKQASAGNTYYTDPATAGPFFPVFRANDEVQWSVQGNTALGIPGFSHYDVELMPRMPYFTLPDTVDISQPLTINHSQTAPDVVAVFYAAMIDSASIFRTAKLVMGNPTSVTFTSAELNAIAAGSSITTISIIVMPISVSKAVYNGRKYYFCKRKSVQFETNYK
jgi:hypothetical protein